MVACERRPLHPIIFILAADETNASLPFSLAHLGFFKVPVHTRAPHTTLAWKIGYQCLLHWGASRLHTDVILNCWTDVLTIIFNWNIAFAGRRLEIEDFQYS